MIIVVVLVVLVINNVILINAKIPSESMEKTIMTGDRIFGFRLSYGINLKIGSFEYSQKFRDPERFDVVIFRYLLSVKRWHSQPHLKAYSFSSIAVKAMHSAVSGERRKQMRRVETVSLNTPIPRTNGLVLEDCIAA